MNQSRILAACAEHEWVDFLFPGECASLSEIVDNPSILRDRYLPSPFYWSAADFALNNIEGIDGEFSTVLEIGGGMGRFCYEFLRSHRVSRYTLSDPMEAKIKFAQSIFRGEIEELTVPVLSGSLNSADRTVSNITVPLGENHRRIQFSTQGLGPAGMQHQVVDMIVCLNVIDHIQNPRDFMAQLAKLLRPDGLLLISSPLDWHEQFTPPENCRDDMRDLLDDQWEVLAEADLPFPFRGRPRRVIFFSSQILLARKRI